jgi:hypothetical protein
LVDKQLENQPHHLQQCGLVPVVSMKALLCFLSAVLTASLSGPGAAAGVVDQTSLQVSVAFPREQFSNGTPVLASVALRNVSAGRILIHYVYGDRLDPVHFRVTSVENGSPVPRAGDLFAYGASTGKPEELELSPGEEKLLRGDLREYFEFPPGRYQVVAEVRTHHGLNETNYYACSQSFPIEVLGGQEGTNSKNPAPQTNLPFQEPRVGSPATRFPSNRVTIPEPEARSVPAGKSPVGQGQIRVALVSLVLLLGFVLAILWRAARRKRES